MRVGGRLSQVSAFLDHPGRFYDVSTSVARRTLTKNCWRGSCLTDKRSASGELIIVDSCHKNLLKVQDQHGSREDDWSSKPNTVGSLSYLIGKRCRVDCQRCRWQNVVQSACHCIRRTIQPAAPVQTQDQANRKFMRWDQSVKNLELPTVQSFDGLFSPNRVSAAKYRAFEPNFSVSRGSVVCIRLLWLAPGHIGSKLPVMLKPKKIPRAQRRGLASEVVIVWRVHDTTLLGTCMCEALLWSRWSDCKIYVLWLGIASAKGHERVSRHEFAMKLNLHSRCINTNLEVSR